ncbi:MAG TPA: patatin-like phospholipase family protein [Dongiaceae bacterium]|nr:patatin-like phospholipase family protein [Dongiaceae bacterium]
MSAAQQQAVQKDGPTAFVFAGGSSLGAVQVGMLKALVSQDIVPDFVVGSSAGAINAAYFAYEPSLAGVEQMDRLWNQLRRDEIFHLTPLGSLWSFLSGRGHMVPAKGLYDALAPHFASRSLDGGRLPCCIITTDMLTGCEYRIQSGPAIPALLASAAIPGVFPSVNLHDRYLIDGGVTNHTPISAALDLGAKTVYVLPTGYSCGLSAPPRTALGAALHALNLLIAQQLVDAVRFARHIADIRVVPPPCPQPVSSYDFSHARELIDGAEQSTLRWLGKGVRLIEGVPPQLPPHDHDDVDNHFGPFWQSATGAPSF